MNRRNFLKFALAGAAAAVTVAATQRAAVAEEVIPDNLKAMYRHPTLASDSTDPVAIQLVLAMDTSGSMTDEEFRIELTASAQALNSELVRSAIKYKAGGNTVAVCLVVFDDSAQVRVGWVDIRGDELNDKPYQPAKGNSSAKPDRLDMLAQEIATLKRTKSGGTTIESAMDLSKRLYLACPWAATERRVLDVFGDGSSYPTGVQMRRDELASMGVTINGFAIVNDEPTLEQFFKDNLVTREYRDGPDGLHSEPGRVWAVARNLKASGNQPAGLRSFFGEVTRGMKQKISVEVAGIDSYARAAAKTGEVFPPVPPRVA